MSKKKTTEIDEILAKIIIKFEIVRGVAKKQLKRLLAKYFKTFRKEKMNKYYLEEIVRIIKHEVLLRGDPYYCTKCKRKHYYGDIFINHKKFALVIRDSV